jgi:hypothetical protein
VEIGSEPAFDRPKSEVERREKQQFQGVDACRRFRRLPPGFSTITYTGSAHGAVQILLNYEPVVAEPSGEPDAQMVYFAPTGSCGKGFDRRAISAWLPKDGEHSNREHQKGEDNGTQDGGTSDGS